jgi:hypothetical protein
VSSETSLDRFLKNRAAVGLGLVDKRITAMQSIMGTIISAFGITVLLAGAVQGTGDHGFGLAMTFAGGMMLAMSQILRRRFRSISTSEWRLSTEAKGLLLKLVRRRLGWMDGGGFSMMGPMAFPMGRHSRRRLRHLAWDTGEPGFGFLSRPAAEVSPEVTELLDVAAEHYNRVAGLVHTPAPRSAIAKLAPAATAAADEAMADILHEAATLEKYPESSSATRKQIETAIRALQELGNRLEEVATRDQSLTDRVDYSSRMDSVLEELRLEQLARSELQKSDGDLGQRLNQDA